MRPSLVAVLSLALLVAAAAAVDARPGKRERGDDRDEDDRERLASALLPRLLDDARDDGARERDDEDEKAAAPAPPVGPPSVPHLAIQLPQRAPGLPPGPLVALAAVAALGGAGLVVRRVRRGTRGASWTDPDARALEMREASRAAAVAEAGGTLAESDDARDLVLLSPGARHAAGGRGCAWSRAFLESWYAAAFAEKAKVVEVSHGARACVLEVR